VESKCLKLAIIEKQKNGKLLKVYYRQIHNLYSVIFLPSSSSGFHGSPDLAPFNPDRHPSLMGRMTGH